MAKIDYNDLKIYRDILEKTEDFICKLDLGVNDFPILGYRFNLEILSKEELKDISKKKKRLKYLTLIK